MQNRPVLQFRGAGPDVAESYLNYSLVPFSLLYVMVWGIAAVHL